MKVLYLSYDGALDPLGQSQVVPYVLGLAGRGHRFSLITWEKPERWADTQSRADLTARLEARGVRWVPLEYSVRPPVLATGMDLLRGLTYARALHEQVGFDLVHVRSYPCALIAQRLREQTGVPFLFDMRGFYPEERVDGGLWKAHGPLFALAKRLEAGFLATASGVVTLTEASRAPLQERLGRAGADPPVFVIPTAVDLERFRFSETTPPPRFVYLGSLGTWYRADRMVVLARRLLAHAPDARVEFVVNGPGNPVSGPLQDELATGRVRVTSVTHAQVPDRLAGATASFSLIAPAPSKVASAPTKLGESLAVGVPLLVNTGVGDGEAWVREHGLGVAVDSLDDDALDRGAAELVAASKDPAIRQRCRGFAERHLALATAVDRYELAYRRCLAPTSLETS